MKTTKDAADEALKEMFSIKPKTQWKPNRAYTKKEFDKDKIKVIIISMIFSIIMLVLFSFIIYVLMFQDQQLIKKL